LCQDFLPEKEHPSMTTKFLRTVVTALLLVLVCGTVRAQEGAVTVPRNLVELATQAQTIVRGRIISATVEPHPTLNNIKTVVVTMHVDQALKGTSDKTLTFRQFIWDYRDRINAEGYRKGQQVLLLLNAPTQLGLTSTAGLGQGRFQIVRDAAGVEYAVNERANRDLMRGVPEALNAKGVKLSAALDAVVRRPASGPIRADQLQAIITRISQGK
jgi:hypothetical protein